MREELAEVGVFESKEAFFRVIQRLKKEELISAERIARETADRPQVTELLTNVRSDRSWFAWQRSVNHVNARLMASSPALEQKRAARMALILNFNLMIRCFGSTIGNFEVMVRNLKLAIRSFKSAAPNFKVTDPSLESIAPNVNPPLWSARSEA